MKRFVSMLTVLALAMCATIAVAEDAAKPKEKPAKPAVPTVRGEVTKIDASSITVKNKDGEKTLTIDANTQVKGKDVKAVSDIKVGDQVVVKYEGDKATGIQVVPAKNASGGGEKKEGKKEGAAKKETH